VAARKSIVIRPLGVARVNYMAGQRGRPFLKQSVGAVLELVIDAVEAGLGQCAIGLIDVSERQARIIEFGQSYCWGGLETDPLVVSSFVSTACWAFSSWSTRALRSAFS
jgi:hypothetical protein